MNGHQILEALNDPQQIYVLLNTDTLEQVRPTDRYLVPLRGSMQHWPLDDVGPQELAVKILGAQKFMEASPGHSNLWVSKVNGRVQLYIVLPFADPNEAGRAILEGLGEKYLFVEAEQQWYPVKPVRMVLGDSPFDV